MKGALGSICNFVNGGTPSKLNGAYFDGHIPWITSADITGPIACEARSFITEKAIAESATNLAPKGTVLLVTRTGVGKVAVAGMDLCFSQDITAITPDPKIVDTAYLVHFLRTQEAHFKKLQRGATIKGITRDVIESLPIPLPPLPEQRRIAAILDQADALRSKRRQALARLDTLTQSIFLETFGDPIGNEKHWKPLAVSDFVADFESGKSLAAPEEEEASGKWRVLKVSAVTSLEYRPEEAKEVPASYQPPTSHIVQAGDLLFSRANTSELIGATAYVFGTPDGLLLPDKIWRFVWPPTPIADPIFVWYLFRHRAVRREIAQRASGTSGSMKNVSQEKVMSIRIGLPPLDAQTVFADQVRSVESQRSTQRASLARLDSLFASLQYRAFRGEL